MRFELADFISEDCFFRLVSSEAEHTNGEYAAEYNASDNQLKIIVCYKI